MTRPSVRIDSSTHRHLELLASELDTTVSETIALAVRALRQDRVGSDLGSTLRHDEIAWLGGGVADRP